MNIIYVCRLDEFRVSLFDDEDFDIIKKFVDRIKKETGVQFNKSEGFTGVSYYVTLRGERMRIANHPQTAKWARIYGHIDKENSLILYSGLDDLEKKQNAFMKRIKGLLKKKEKVVYATLGTLVKTFKSPSDIKVGKYKVWYERHESEWEIVAVDKKREIATVVIEGDKKEIPFKYVMNWVSKGKEKEFEYSRS